MKPPGTRGAVERDRHSNGMDGFNIVASSPVTGRTTTVIIIPSAV